MPTEEQIIKMKWNSKKGWILEVDLEYPTHLHDAHNDYPLAPGKKTINPGKPIIEFVGLKSKMYSYRTESKNNKTAKGVKKNIIRRDIDHSDYLETLFDCKIMRHKMRTIRSEYHQVRVIN